VRAQRCAQVVIPAGTHLTIRMIDSIDSTKTAASERSRASIDDPVVVGTQTVIARGTDGGFSIRSDILFDATAKQIQVKITNFGHRK
jgi:hypothetical protein